VPIFGSARIPEDLRAYTAVRDVAEEHTRMGCDIITGGEPGPMAAANEGATCADANARNRSVGIRVQLPFGQHVA
jgi:predicted Rossmann-fold nucleotide-binding protein